MNIHVHNHELMATDKKKVRAVSFEEDKHKNKSAESNSMKDLSDLFKTLMKDQRELIKVVTETQGSYLKLLSENKFKSSNDKSSISEEQVTLPP